LIIAFALHFMPRHIERAFPESTWQQYAVEVGVGGGRFEP
jgi:hypothetical protein